MGTKAIEIVKTDVKNLIEQLNKAFADEWLAYYQYWIGAKVAKGPMRTSVITELEQHATEELGHALLLSERIIQLGGTPILKPEDWYKQTNCGYETPADPYVVTLLNQNIKGEQCAIEVYKKITDLTKDTDWTTFNIAQGILADEIEHEEDLQSLLEDIDIMFKKTK